LPHTSWLILVAGVVATLVGWHVWRSSADGQFRDELARSADALSQQLASNVRRQDQMLTSATAFFAASRRVDPGGFDTYGRVIGLGRRSREMRSMVWISGPLPSARVRYASRRDGWAEPGAEVTEVGGLSLALGRAAKSGRSVLTRTYSGLTGTPEDFAIVRPVYDGGPRPTSPRARSAVLRGWVALKLRGNGFLASDLSRVPEHLRATLVSPDGEAVSWSEKTSSPPVAPGGSVSREDPVLIYGRRWAVRTTALRTGQAGLDRVGPAVTLIAGLGLSLLLFALARMRLRAVREAREGRRSLQENEELFRTLAGSSPVGICLLDETGEARYVNRRWSDIHGTGSADDLGKPLLPALHPADESGWTAAQRRARSGAETDIECRICRPDGEERWVNYGSAALRRTNGDIRGWVVSAGDVSERKAYESELKERALHDELTGLPNRALLMERLSHALATSTRKGETTAVLFIDLDRLKLVNDSLGHSCGDEVIKTAARRLDGVLRPEDTVGRFAGDAFVTICESVTDEIDVVAIAERIILELRRPAEIDGRRLSIGASIGIAFAGPGDDAEGVLRDADAAMYHAKASGGAAIELFDSRLKSKAQERLDVESALRDALEREELELHYQPRVSLIDGNVEGFEALVRWRRPDHGLVAPGEFIGVAEETGLIMPIGAWVLEEACRQAAEWNEGLSGGEQLSMSVNVSARQIREPGLPRAVAEAVRLSGVDPACLWLEITETVLLETHGDVLTTLEEIKRLGVRLSLDDFGTGYSSLSYLKGFPIDELKIDRSFVMDLGDGDQDHELVGAIVAMGHALGFPVLAEGVETQMQLEALRGFGVELAQGYLFSRPLPAAEAGALLTGPRLVVRS